MISPLTFKPLRRYADELLTDRSSIKSVVGGPDLLDSTIEGRERELEARLDSYGRLAEVFHHVLSEQSLDALLDRIADTLGELLQYDTLIIYEADESRRMLLPVLARDPQAEEILKSPSYFGEGITGHAVQRREPILANHAHLHPLVSVIPGTTLDPESFICVPLIARGAIKGALNIYRQGEEAVFTYDELQLAKRFGDAAALALDNAQSRAALEHQAQTDSLTGLYNHRHYHERLRSELHRTSRVHDSVSIMAIDIDDFKRVNDIYGHATGDAVLTAMAELLCGTVRASDVVCRLGGEEFAVILPSCDAGDSHGLALRIRERLATMNFDPAGKITVSIGIAQGPQHAANPRELSACADAAMMTAKARGKDRVVLFEDETGERPHSSSSGRDVRSIAHLKMLQSLSGKLNRLNDVREIGLTIANELRTLIDYHSCRVYLLQGNELRPIAFCSETIEVSEGNIENWTVKVGQGITGRAAATGQSLLIPNALECEWSVQVPGTHEIEESLVVTPLTYGTRVIGIVAISKLGVNQFDEDDVRLLEVLGGQASVALENARLYENQRHEAEQAKALLDFADALSKAPSVYAITHETAGLAAKLLDSRQATVWMQDERTGEYRCASHRGYVGEPEAEPVVRRVLSRQEGDDFLGGRDQPFVLTPSEALRNWSEPPAQFVPHAIAVGPLHGVNGWIVVRHPNPEATDFSEDRLRALAGISYQTSIALQKALLYRDQKESAEIANSLLDFSRELARTETMSEVLERIVTQCARILGAPRTMVWLQDDETGELYCEAFIGVDDELVPGLLELRFGAEVARPWLANNEPWIYTPGSVPGVAPTLLSDGGPIAVAPLRIEGGRMGCIVASAPVLGDYEFSERKMRLLAGIASQSQLAINNARSFEGLERTFFSTVETLANALEAKDEYTSSHARSIKDLALDVGHALGLDVKSLKSLELGALFHDIGKIGIPSQILLKEGPLTDEEWAIIKTHPELGERILAPIERLTDVRPIVRHCHEHFDGGGYPDGLAGEAIPLESRIILVVDAFHAITSDRPYRKAAPAEEAIRRLRAASGAEFDPLVVDVFCGLMENRVD